jgi:hypothetical protein
MVSTATCLLAYIALSELCFSRPSIQPKTYIKTINRTKVD